MRNPMSLAALATALLLVGCGGSDEQSSTPAPNSAHSDAAAPAEKTTAQPPAPPATALAGADTSAPDPERGRVQYLTFCASCHGESGGGDGPLSETLDPRPARHNDPRYMNALSDEHLFRVIKFGGAAVGKSPTMAPWGGALTDTQIRDVVAFVRTLANPSAKSP